MAEWAPQAALPAEPPARIWWDASCPKLLGRPDMALVKPGRADGSRTQLPAAGLID